MERRSVSLQTILLSPRTWIAAGGGASVLGVFVAGSAPAAHGLGAEGSLVPAWWGGVLVLVGWGLLAWGIHRFGRSGSDGNNESNRRSTREEPPMSNRQP